MQHPTIYKPSIYKGPTVYNTGAGAGGEIWRDWYDELDYISSTINTVEFDSTAFYSIVKPTDVLEINFSYKYDWGMDFNCMYGIQGGNEDWARTEIGGYSSKLDTMITQPRNYYARSYGNSEGIYVSTGYNYDIKSTRNKDGVIMKIKWNNTDYELTYNVPCNNTSEWRCRIIRLFKIGGGNGVLKFYDFNLYDENELDNPKLKIIPVKRKFDGLLGFLEIKYGLFTRSSYPGNLSGPT